MCKCEQIKFVSIEDLVPQDHILRYIDKAIDFNFIYDEVKGLYSETDWGKPGIDPVALFKIVFIQYLFGIRSMRQTIKEIAKNREMHGKKPLKDDNDNNNQPPKPPATKTVTQSRTDPECGMFHKGEHEKQFAYVANTACDRHNFILDFVLSAGNIHDSMMFSKVYEKVVKRFPKILTVAIDSGYKTPAIMKQIIDSGRIPCVPYKRPMTKKGFFKKYDLVYDEYFDCILCPNNQTLKYSTTNREGYREYKSNPEICKSCPMRSKCTESTNAGHAYFCMHEFKKVGNMEA